MGSCTLCGPEQYCVGCSGRVYGESVVIRLRAELTLVQGLYDKALTTLAEGMTPKQKPSGIQWKQKLEEYQAIAADLGTPIPQLFSKSNRAAYRSRASEFGPDWWDRAMVELRQANAFCTGDNDRGWRINMKYVLSPSGAEKLLDGEWRRDSEASQAGVPSSIDDLFPEGE